MMASTKLGLLVFLIYFAVIIPKLRADPATNITSDTFWKEREAEAIKAALEAYDEFPLEITNTFNKIVGKSEEAINRTRRSLLGSNHTGRGLLSYGRTYSYERTYSYRRTHSYVRTHHHRRKFRGGCQATNPIDRCWRCRQNWAHDRKRLASCPLGFGRRATGGRDGHFYVVTDSSDNDVQNPKPGTLRYAVIQNRPLWITFAQNMVIRLQQELIFTSHKTLDGRGANVHIAYGAGITIQFVKNVIIHNLHIHDTVPSYGGLIRDSVDHMGFRTMADGDGITIFGSCHIWLDHLSMYNCKDGLIDAVQGSTAITISNSYFTRHNDVILLGASDSYDHDKIMQVTVAFNHFGKHLIQRMPRCRWGFFHVVNNDYTQWEMYAIGGSSQPTIISQGNRFCAPNNPAAKEVTKRDYAMESEWSHWTWRSEGDLMLNGAFFRQSGSPVGHRPTSRRDMIKAKSGRAAGRLTRFAGALDCHIGQKC